MPKYFLIPNLFMILVFVLLANIVNGAEFSGPKGARSNGIGNASVTLSDFWSIYNNQAGLARYNNLAVGVYYENRFLVKELSTRGGAFVLPVGSGVFGLGYDYFGYSQFNQQKIGLAYARAFGSKFSVGIQLDYLSTRIAQDYGNRNAFTFEIGLQSEIFENLFLAAHLFNPLQVKLEDEYNERIPAVFKFGLSYNIADNLFIAIETEKDSEFKPLIRGGLEYVIVEEAIVRIGYSTLPANSGSENFSIASLYTFGFGLQINKFYLDLSSSFHQTLGWSPQVSLIYKFK